MPSPAGGAQDAQALSKQEAADIQALARALRSASAAGLLAKQLDVTSRQQLLAALDSSQRKLEPPPVTRTAMVDERCNNHGQPVPPPVHTVSAAAIAAAAALTPDAAEAATLAAAAAAAAGEAATPEPTGAQLLRVGVTKALPFVAFGFFDNIIMITAGEQIDLMFGAKLGLSSMAAAGLGNTVADVVGINISHTIEQKFKSMESMAPRLSKAQLALPRTQRAKWLGCALGMATGCLLGLTPLLFYDAGAGEHGSGAGAQRGPAAVAAPAGT